MAVTEKEAWGDREGIMQVEGRVLKPGDKIHDLRDVAEDSPLYPSAGPAVRKAGPEKIYDLVDVVERKPKMALVDPGLRDEILKRASEIAEKVAREIIPDIAERVIREEIEKLKKET